MEKLIELQTENILVSSSVLTYKNPDFIYIPILKNSKILVHQGIKVKIGTPIIETEDATLTSSISGTIKSIKKMNTINGYIDTIEIMNDFEETYLKETKTKRNLNSISHDKFNEYLAKHHLVIDECDTLVLNCIDDEPYILSENFYLYLYSEEFLELLDKLAKVYELNKVMICVKASSSHNINNLLNHLGMYPNISLEIIPDLYLIGQKNFLLDYLNLDITKTSVIKASIFYNLYNDIKRNRMPNDKLITISGNNIKNPSILRVKIGSDLENLNNIIEINSNSTIYAGGLMTGKKVDLKNFIVTNNLDGLIIMQNKAEPKIYKCLNCGLCSNICPVGLNPILLNNKKFHNKVINKCLNCGLCSYICPSHIHFNTERINENE